MPSRFWPDKTLVEHYLPDDYIEDVGLRLSFYKRLASAEDEQEVVDLADASAVNLAGGLDLDLADASAVDLAGGLDLALANASAVEL